MKHFRTIHITQRRLTQSGVTAALALSLGLAAHAQTPIVSYNFNDNSASGNTTASSGSYGLSDAALTFYPTPGYVLGGSNTPGNLHGAAGSGVSGAAADLAFDNSAATNMGSLGTAGCALTTTSVSGLAGPLTSFTVTGWFKSNASADFLNDSARLLDTGSGAGEIAILGTRGGEIQFLINGQKVYSNASYTLKNTWTFFAITYDSVAGAASFYIGYRPQDFTSTTPPNGTVSAVSIGAENSGGTGGAVPFSTNPGTAAFTGGLDIGNSVAAGAGNNRGFAGLMDDVAIYGTALTQTQIDQIRQASIAPPITGNVALQGVTSPNLAQPMVFTLIPTGGTLGVVTTQTVTPTSTTGAYTLSGLLPGTYTIGVKGAKWLQQDQTNIITTTTTAPSLGFNLLGGDLNGDNTIDFSDFLILRNQFNQTGPGLAADINCDGTVDFSDFLILRNNFNLSGNP
jgi:hypothetical protein